MATTNGIISNLANTSRVTLMKKFEQNNTEIDGNNTQQYNISLYDAPDSID